ncbi:MAG: spore germination YkwD domain-containing protein [Acidimicrobiales bacterium]
MGPNENLRRLAAGLVAVALAAAGLALSAGTAGAAASSAPATGATPIESRMATQVLAYTNQDRAARHYQQMQTSQYLATMAQAYVYYESTPANPIESGTSNRYSDPGGAWVSAYLRSHPCSGVCPWITVPATPRFVATTNGSSSAVWDGSTGRFASSTFVLGWRASPPHWDNLMSPGWTMAGVGVDCATGFVDILTGSTSHVFNHPNAPQSPTPNVIPAAMGTSCSSRTPSPTTGYRMVAGDGGVFAFGTAPFYGSMGGHPLNRPVVASAATPTGHGYWEVASDGGIFSFGNAQFHGSMGGKPLNQPIVGMAVDPATGGYWEVASDGGIFAFNAPFYGSMGGHPLNQPIVGMAATPTGGGYWEVARDGGIFSFGNAQFHGSMGGHPLNQPIVGMAATPTGGGYWEVSTTGGIFSFDAPFYGSGVGLGLGTTVVGMAATPTGGGYWIANALGQVANLGSATNDGMITGPLAQPIVGFSA